MKKVLSIVCALILALLFSACTPNKFAADESTTVSNTTAESQTESIVAPAAEDEYADLSHLPEAKKYFFQKLGFTPSSLRTAFSGDLNFTSTAHRGVVSVYTGDLYGNDKKKEAIVVTLLDDGGMDRIQANYYYSGDEGLATEVLLSVTLDYTFHPGHSDPPTLFVYRHGGKTWFCTQYNGGNEYGGGSFAHHGLVYTEILPNGKTAAPISLEYGHHAGQMWYARVYEGDQVLSSSMDIYGGGGYEKEVSFDAINARLREIGLPAFEGMREYMRVPEINEKTPGVTMLVSGSLSFPEDGGYADGTWMVEYTDHVRYGQRHK